MNEYFVRFLQPNGEEKDNLHSFLQLILMRLSWVGVAKQKPKF